MGRSYVLEVIDFVDSHVHFVLENEIKELIGIVFEFFPRRNVVEESRS